MLQGYKKPREVCSELGVGREFLRKAAERGELPDGAVLCTPGNHHSYDIEMVRKWLQENFKHLTRAKRMEAQARKSHINKAAR